LRYNAFTGRPGAPWHPGGLEGARPIAKETIDADCAFMTDTFRTSLGTHNPASLGTFPRYQA
jgi:hypothetical protein